MVEEEAAAGLLEAFNGDQAVAREQHTVVCEFGPARQHAIVHSDVAPAGQQPIEEISHLQNPLPNRPRTTLTKQVFAKHPGSKTHAEGLS